MDLAHAAFVPHRDALERLLPLLGKPEWLEHFNLSNAPGIRLVADDTDRGAFDYEQFIQANGDIPTRVHALHDLMNALVWRTFPVAKRMLNARHVTEGVARHSANGRSALRDGLTLFDESGIVIVGGDAEMEAAHRGQNWSALWGRHRVKWSSMSVWVFGHGLLESIATKRHDGLIGKALWVHSREALDAELAARIARADDTFKQSLYPIPLCGIPGWDTRNEEASFYENTRIFRPQRRASLR